MNEIDLLRDYRADVSGPTPETTQAACARLGEAIERELAQRLGEPRAARLGYHGSGRQPRRRLALAAAIVLLAIGMVLALTLGGSSSGPARALAIDKGPRWVTLTLKDPQASEDEMNQQLADAGIDRVRVRSVPGPPQAVGTWAGFVLLGPYCRGVHFVNDVRIPRSSRRPETSATIHRTRGRFDLTLPRRRGVLSGVFSVHRHLPARLWRSALRVGALRVVKIPGISKSTVRVRTASVDNPGKTSAKVLIATRPPSPDDPPEANDIGVEQLKSLGGVFADYGQAIESGDTACSNFGLKPLGPDFEPVKGVKLTTRPPVRPGSRR